MPVRSALPPGTARIAATNGPEAVIRTVQAVTRRVKGHIARCSRPPS